MKTNHLIMKNYLQEQPKARERKNKNRAIGNVIMERYNIQIDKAMMSDIVGEILNYDRVWRKILEDYPDLRGSDYGHKDKLEEETINTLRTL